MASQATSRKSEVNAVVPGASEALPVLSYAARIAASVSPYDVSDREALRAFQLAHFGVGSRQADDRYFKWLFECNPHQRRDAPVVWICKRDGLVVGQQARLPVTLKVGCEEQEASWGVDLMVDPQWRLKGIGPALFAEYERSSAVLLGLGLSENSYRGCIRSGWSDMGRLPLLVRPLDTEVCATALGDRQWLARLAPDLLVKGSARAMGVVMQRLARCSLDRVHTFDERVDSVWTAASRDYSIVVKRDFLSLRWRFDESPDAADFERYYLTRRGEVLGYAVIRFDTWRGHKIARLVDHLSPRKLQVPLLAMLIDALRGRNAVALFIEQLTGNRREAMMALGCFRVGAATRFIVKATRRATSLAGTLCHAAQWFVTPADSDSDLPFYEGAPAAVRSQIGV